MTINEARPLIFLAVFALIFSWEQIRNNYAHQYRSRLFHNMTMLGLSILMLKFVFPAGLFALTYQVPSQPWHLSQLPFVFNLILTVLLFDLAIYWQHRWFHRFNWLWHFHAIHHSDKTLDATSALRFHPGEIMLSGFYKGILILILGPSAETYLIYEIILSSMAIFNHGNIYLSPFFERKLRCFIVTPQMHYPHHSPQEDLINKNYGNFLSLWDRLFKTYTETENTKFGLKSFSHENLKQLITYPLSYDIFKYNSKK